MAEIKMVAVLSAPMCGWNPHWGCVQEAFVKHGIPVWLGSGAYWHQTMQNLMEQACDKGLDWVLTLDYDSMFRATDVDRLIETFAANPYADALAAMQVRRGSLEQPLMHLEDDRTEVELNNQPLKVRTAHFGFTFFRCDKLRDFPKPWFVGLPGPDGRYDDNRVDADINFWLKWREQGNTVYIDPNCRIGHLQPMVAEFQEETIEGKPYIVPRHVHVNEWRARRANVEVL